MLNLERNILFRKHCVIGAKTRSEYWAHYAAYLLDKFAVMVDKPELLDADVVKFFEDMYYVSVPKAFYDNPQAVRFYTAGELFLNQALAYFARYGEEDSSVDIFKPLLPRWVQGDELVLRQYCVVDDDEANCIFSDYWKELAAYTRPWSASEYADAAWLRSAGHMPIGDYTIACRDNALALVPEDINFATNLDWKDLVKLSISTLGEQKDLSQAVKRLSKDTALAKLMRNVSLLKPVGMSKRQAKYFKTLCKYFGVEVPKLIESPYKQPINMFKRGAVQEAARLFANKGSLLERNLKMLLSRCHHVEEMQGVLQYLEAKNPMVLYQLATSLTNKEGPRTFTFYRDHKVHKHVETEYETTWRKSDLAPFQQSRLLEAVVDRMEDYYSSLPSLGKVFIGSEFDRVAPPINTTANGTGLDVLPTGSRIPIRFDKVRSFVTWKNAYDIDSSLMLVKDDGAADVLSYWNYHSNVQLAQFSGDVTSPTGTEYWDIDVANLRQRGYRWVVQSLIGYADDLSKGTIEVGCQTKTDFMTKAWDPKNIKFKFAVKGNTRACVAFAIDLLTNEIIVLNQLVDSVERNTNESLIKGFEKYLNTDYLDFNMARLLSMRNIELVEDPAGADWVFASAYEGTDGVAQQIVRPWDTSTLATLLSE